jgi:hypothetical protein
LQWSKRRKASKVGDVFAALYRQRATESNREQLKVKDAEAPNRNRVCAALSALISGDELPLKLPAVPLPFTSDDFHEIFYRSVDELQNSPSNSDENDEEIENDDDDDTIFLFPNLRKLKSTHRPSN